MPAEASAGRYSAEKSKLRAQQALRLKLTMSKLVACVDYSDVLLESSDGQQLPAHICILKSRAPGFYRCYVEQKHQELQQHQAATNAEQSTKDTFSVKITDVDYNSLKFFLQCIYTAEEVPNHPTMVCDPVFTTSSMSSSSYEPAADNDDEDRFVNGTSTSQRTSMVASDHSDHVVAQSPMSNSTKLATSTDSHGSNRTYTLEDQEKEMSKSDLQTPRRQKQLSSMSASCTDRIPLARDCIEEETPSKMMTSFVELATISQTKTGSPCKNVKSESQDNVALTASMESSTSDEHTRDSNPHVHHDASRSLTRRSKEDVMIGKFIHVDGGSSGSAEESPMSQQTQPADKKIFPMFFEMDNARPLRLSFCEGAENGSTTPAMVRRNGSSCTIDSPGRGSQMGRKRWSVTSLRSIDSADLASPLSSHGSVIGGVADDCLSVNEENALQGACSRLGKDLLAMFTTASDTDLTIVTGDSELKAHRCILAGSCPYFKAMLDGDWLENRSSVVELKGFSEAAIKCALCLIYGGVVDIPDNVSVWELITFADMIQLEDLKQVAHLHIRGKYCHFFHKPCSGCVTGVLECLPFLRSFGISDLLEKCCQWQAKYFGRIWKTKAFNMLSEDILDMCYRSVVESITPTNVLDILLGCEKLQLTLPRSKTSEAAGALVACLTDASLEYLAANFDSVIVSDEFANLGKGYALNLSIFEDLLPSVIHSLSPDAGCKSMIKLYELMTLIASQQQTGEENWNERFINLLRRLYELCDTHLIHCAGAAVNCDSWALLTPDMQRRIKETGIFVDFRQPKAPPPRLSSSNKIYKRSSSSADRVRDRSVSVQRYKLMTDRGGQPETPKVAPAPPSTNGNSTQVNSATLERRKPKVSMPKAATVQETNAEEPAAEVNDEVKPKMSHSPTVELLNGPKQEQTPSDGGSKVTEQTTETPAPVVQNAQPVAAPSQTPDPAKAPEGQNGPSPSHRKSPRQPQQQQTPQEPKGQQQQQQPDLKSVDAKESKEDSSKTQANTEAPAAAKHESHKLPVGSLKQPQTVGKNQLKRSHEIDNLHAITVQKSDQTTVIDSNADSRPSSASASASAPPPPPPASGAIPEQTAVNGSVEHRSVVGDQKTDANQSIQNGVADQQSKSVAEKPTPQKTRVAAAVAPTLVKKPSVAVAKPTAKVAGVPKPAANPSQTAKTSAVVAPTNGVHSTPPTARSSRSNVSNRSARSQATDASAAAKSRKSSATTGKHTAK